ncbi:hypothetical protein PHBOTO_000068 [Pseudozyma hubeiensis]|nr:hypothetical protein PHBOTO_000068 [Pseudozyma hubeiensis]
MKDALHPPTSATPRRHDRHHRSTSCLRSQPARLDELNCHAGWTISFALCRLLGALHLSTSLISSDHLPCFVCRSLLQPSYHHVLRRTITLRRVGFPRSPIFERRANRAADVKLLQQPRYPTTLHHTGRQSTWNFVRPVGGTDTCLQAPVYQLHRKPHIDPSSEAATCSALIFDSFNTSIDRQTGTHLRQHLLRDQLESSHDTRSTFTLLPSQIRHPLLGIPGCLLTFSSLDQSCPLILGSAI